MRYSVVKKIIKNRKRKGKVMENKKKDKKNRKYWILISIFVFITLGGIAVYLYIDNNYVAPFTINDEITIEGEVLNAEKGHERAVVDFVYFK